MNIAYKKHRHDTLSFWVAALLALAYMWVISLTAFRQTGLQFVAPLLIIFITHTVWSLSTHGLVKNVLLLISRKTARTAISLLMGVLLFSILTPEPAQSDAASFALEAFTYIATALYCLLMIAIVVAVVGGFFYILIRMAQYFLGSHKNNSDDDDHNKMNEIASIVLVGAVLVAASLEGVSGATQPEFPLPAFISVFPRPVAVMVDEGTALHAKRVVKFKGREGEGLLSLKVVERSANHTRFNVLSDTSPLAQWIAHQAIEYQVSQTGTTTELSVSLKYERLLAPAWFFDPLMNVTTTLAMNVLARDVKARAEMMHPAASLN